MISRKTIIGQRQMLVQIYMKRGAQVPVHTHESEQMVYVLQGALRFLVNGREVIVRAGEVLDIPSGVPHQTEAIDDTFDLAVFSERREG
jgi:quercetin dioxygenase-like cupin family protein